MEARPRGFARYRARALALLVAVLLLFSLSEYAQAGWLIALGRVYPHLAQVVQGVSSTLICVLLLAWVLARASPPPMPTVSSADDWLRGIWPDEREWLHTFAGWFIAVRWVAIGVASILAVVTIYVARLLSSEAAQPLMATVAGLALSNVIYRLLLSRNSPRARSSRQAPAWMGPRAFLALQIYGDLAFFGALLHFSGGIENPLSLLMVLHVIIGAAVGRRQSYAVASVATVLVALLGWAELQPWFSHYTLLIFPHFHDSQGVLHAADMSAFVMSLIVLHGVIFYVTAFFVSALAERVRYDERQLAAVATGAIASRHLLERALENTGTGLRVLDPKLRPYWSNAQWLRWFAGDRPADPIAAETLVTGQVQVAERVAAPPADNQPAAGAQRKTADRILRLTAAPLLDKNGAIHQIVELFQDITSEKETRAQAIRAGKLAAVGELAGQVAHEVNNPMTIISAKARLLLQHHAAEMSEGVAQELRKIVEQSDRVAQIALGLLSYCRPSTGLRSPLSLRGPARRAVRIIEQRARGQQVVIDEQLSEALPMVVANDGEMQQVFLNLFLNALDAMPDGGTLGIGGRGEEGFVAIVVSDTGMGIAPEIRGRIFEPFVTTKEEGRGTGLGLSICLGLINSHGGRISVESEIAGPARGSSFTLRLPVAAEARPGGVLDRVDPPRGSDSL